VSTSKSEDYDDEDGDGDGDERKTRKEKSSSFCFRRSSAFAYFDRQSGARARFSLSRLSNLDAHVARPYSTSSGMSAGYRFSRVRRF
jgi:hypothetical protein